MIGSLIGLFAAIVAVLQLAEANGTPEIQMAKCMRAIALVAIGATVKFCLPI